VPIDEDDVLRAGERAAAHARAGERVVAVLAAETISRGVVYLCALGEQDAQGEGEAAEAALAWVALDAAGEPVRDEAVVRDAASLAALCETAEEASAALVAEDTAAAARHALELAGGESDGLRDALREALAATEALAAESDGVRVASAAYLDRLAGHAHDLASAAAALQPEAETLSGHLSGAPGDPREPLARAVWEVLARVREAGQPSRFADVVAAAAGPVDALASDVVGSLRDTSSP
jgi:hypothetical protein